MAGLFFIRLRSVIGLPVTILEPAFDMKWMGFELVTIAALGVASHLAPAIAASAAAQQVQSAPRTDFVVRRYSPHRYRTIDQPSYYGRPHVYAPAPFVPIPPFFGYGWEWW